MTDLQIQETELLRTEITVLKKELEDKNIRLDEAFSLIDDKEQELDRERLLIGELELKIRDLEKKPSEQLGKVQAELDIALEENKQLRAIEGARTKQFDFQPASKVQSPQQVWVAAVNAFNLYKGLKDGSLYATANNDPWRKVVFDIANDGQLKNARLQQQEDG